MTWGTRRNQLGAATPQLGTRRVVRDDLAGARRAVLEADQAPAFAHRRVDPDVTSVVERVELAVADDPAAERVHLQPLAEPHSRSRPVEVNEDWTSSGRG